MIDRNCNATILAGASDERLALKVLDYARSTRERFHIRSSDFDLGALLHHDVPFLASVTGATMTQAERAGNPHVSGGLSRDRSIGDAARHVVRSVAYSVGMPDNCLVVDPTQGNAAAILIDRVAVLAGVSRIDEDGPRDALSSHMAMSSVREGRAMSTEWTPGWRTGNETDVRRFSETLFTLDDRQLAAELLEQARDARVRLGIADGSGPEQTMLWQTVPAMAALFGARLERGEGERFRLSVKDLDDQRTFEVASSLLGQAVGSGAILGRPRLTLGDRALFADPAEGNSAAFLLDRAALALGAERGGPTDPVGMAVLAAGRASASPHADHAWRPTQGTTGRSTMIMAAHARASGLLL